MHQDAQCASVVKRTELLLLLLQWISTPQHKFIFRFTTALHNGFFLESNLDPTDLDRKYAHTKGIYCFPAVIPLGRAGTDCTGARKRDHGGHVAIKSEKKGSSPCKSFYNDFFSMSKYSFYIAPANKTRYGVEHKGSCCALNPLTSF